MKTSEEIIEVSKALCLAQQQMKPAIKDSTNPHFRSKYSDLSSIWESIRTPVTSNGLSIWQDVTTCEKSVSVTTRVTHISGQWVEFGPLSIPLIKQDAQSIGSAISYGKRYALCAAVGVVSDDDDDGEKAMGREKQKEATKPKTIEKLQWTELNRLIDQCDSDYQKNIWDYLESQNIGSFENMPESVFHKLKKGCISNMESRAKNA